MWFAEFGSIFHILLYTLKEIKFPHFRCCTASKCFDLFFIINLFLIFQFNVQNSVCYVDNQNLKL